MLQFYIVFIYIHIINFTYLIIDVLNRHTNFQPYILVVKKTANIQIYASIIDVIFLFYFFSSYPLILSIENHCTLPQQRKMAMAFKDLFGGWYADLYVVHQQLFIVSVPNFLQTKQKVNPPPNWYLLQKYQNSSFDQFTVNFNTV